MKSKVRRTDKTLFGNGRRTVTYTEGEWAARGCLSAILIWPFKIIYYVTIGWIVALFRRKNN